MDFSHKTTTTTTLTPTKERPTSKIYKDECTSICSQSHLLNSQVNSITINTLSKLLKTKKNAVNVGLVSPHITFWLTQIPPVIWSILGFQGTEYCEILDMFLLYSPSSNFSLRVERSKQNFFLFFFFYFIIFFYQKAHVVTLFSISKSGLGGKCVGFK